MSFTLRLLAGFNRNAVGSAAVEFALTVPALLLLLFGTFEFGRLLWTQNSIQYVVEQAARCAAFKLPGCANASETQTFAALQMHGTVASSAFTVTYQCPSGTGCTACGVANTKGVLVAASVPFTPLLASTALTPFESSLSITLTGQSCRPQYT